MDKAILEMYLGKRIIIQWEHEIGEPKRKHKKKRIAKKWLKKYGTWKSYENGVCPYIKYVVLTNDCVFMSRQMYIRLRNQHNIDFIQYHIPHHGNNFIH